MRSSAGGEASMMRAGTLRARVVGLVVAALVQWLIAVWAVAEPSVRSTSSSALKPTGVVVSKASEAAAAWHGASGTKGRGAGEISLKRVSPLLAGACGSAAVAGRGALSGARQSLPERVLRWIARAPSELLAAASERARGWFALRLRAREHKVAIAQMVSKRSAVWAGEGQGREAKAAAGGKASRGQGEVLSWATVRQPLRSSRRPRGWFALRLSARPRRTDSPKARRRASYPLGARSLAFAVWPRRAVTGVGGGTSGGEEVGALPKKAAQVSAAQQQPQPGAAAGTTAGGGASTGSAAQGAGPAAVAPAAGVRVGVPLGPGDIVAITVLDEPKLTGQFMIREDGKLNLAVLGLVQAAGMTATQLEDHLTKLCKKYIINPVVSVVPVSTQPRIVSVLGQVARPGTYDVRQCPTLLSLLAAAGGVLPTGDLSQAVLVRGQKTVRVLPEGAKEAVPRDIALQPGDALYVPPRTSPIVHVMGAVIKPGPQALKAANTASKVVILAGGPAPDGDLRHAYILRGQKRIDVNLEPFLGAGKKSEAKDVALEPGDVVVVPPKVQKHVYVVGAVNSPGPQPVDEARLVSQAIAMAGGLSEVADKTGAYLLREGKKIPLDLKGLFEEGKVEADLALEPGDAIVVPKELPIFHIVGRVKKPGAYSLEQAETVLEAWSLAGGEEEDADLSHCVLLRKGEQPKTIDIETLVYGGDTSQDVALKPGDKLLVPKAVKYVYVLGQVANPGPKPYKPGQTLIDLIGQAGGPTAIADVKSIVLVHPEKQTAEKKKRRYRRKGEKAEKEAKPVEGFKVTLVDLARVRTEGKQYVAQAGDVIYIPALRQGQRINWLMAILPSVITGLLVRQ